MQNKLDRTGRQRRRTKAAYADRSDIARAALLPPLALERAGTIRQPLESILSAGELRQIVAAALG